MSEKETGGGAFPACNEANVNMTIGMTLRDYFAGQALAGMLNSKALAFLSRDGQAKVAYEYADAMLEARK